VSSTDKKMEGDARWSENRGVDSFQTWAREAGIITFMAQSGSGWPLSVRGRFCASCWLEPVECANWDEAEKAVADFLDRQIALLMAERMKVAVAPVLRISLS